MVRLKIILTKLAKHPLFLILLVAAFFRLFNLTTNPPGLNWDEASMGVSANSLLHTGRDEWGSSWPLLFRSYGEWKSPVYIYLLIPFIKIFGMTPLAVRLPAVISGLLAIYLTYLITKKLFDRPTAYAAAILLSFSPWHLMLSRPAFEATVALTLTLLGTYLFLLFGQRGSSKIKYSLLSSIAFGLSVHTYHSAKIVVPLLLVYLVWAHRQVIKLRSLVLPFIILTIFALPILLDFTSGRSLRRFNQVGITTDTQLVERFYHYRDTFPLPSPLPKLVFNKYTFILAQGFINYTSYLSPHFLLGSESIRAQHSIPFRGVMYLSELGLFIYGLYWLIRSPRRPLQLGLPVAAILFGFIPPALTKDAYHVLRSILTLPYWQIVAAYGLTKLISRKNKYRNLVLLGYAAEVLIFLFLYFFWYPQAFAPDWQYGHQQLAAYFSQVEGKYDHIVMSKVYGEPQIFMAFYQRWDPLTLQANMSNLKAYENLALPWVDQLKEYSLGKWTFRDIDWSKDQFSHHTLFIGKSTDFYADTPVLYSLNFPGGANAWTVVSTP